MAEFLLPSLLNRIAQVYEKLFTTNCTTGNVFHIYLFIFCGTPCDLKLKKIYIVDIIFRRDHAMDISCVGITIRRRKIAGNFSFAVATEIEIISRTKKNVCRLAEKCTEVTISTTTTTTITTIGLWMTIRTIPSKK